MTDTAINEPAQDAGAAAAQTAFFSSITQALGSVPEGSVLRAVGFESDERFLRAGYRMTDGDSDVTVALGGEKEFAAARRTVCRRLILCPTHDFYAAASRTYIVDDGGFCALKQGKKPSAAVFDKSLMHENLASVFGELLALDLGAFDLTFGAHMRGERADLSLCKDVAALISGLTAELKGCEKDRDRASGALLAAGQKAARLVETVPALPYASGAIQVAEAMRMLCVTENRNCGMRGEMQAALAPYITEFYIKTLTTDCFEFPPDNAKRIDALCEYLGADLRRATVHAAPVYPPIKMRLCEYRRDEFRSELLQLLGGIKKRRIEAWRVFKRLYRDDGYGLSRLVDKSDVAICLALAPDVFAADTMLAFIKQTGRLERYIA